MLDPLELPRHRGRIYAGASRDTASTGGLDARRRARGRAAPRAFGSTPLCDAAPTSATPSTIEAPEALAAWASPASAATGSLTTEAATADGPLAAAGRRARRGLPGWALPSVLLAASGS